MCSGPPLTVWQPPTRLAYLWYLGRDKADATEVEIRFHPQGAAQTRVDIEHRGWERVGEQWRDRTRIGWQTLLPHYRKEITRGRWH